MNFVVLKRHLEEGRKQNIMMIKKILLFFVTIVKNRMMNIGKNNGKNIILNADK